MEKTHLFLCGGTTAVPRQKKHNELHRLWIHGDQSNVLLKLTNISRPFALNIPDEIMDLLDIAAYVYAADQTVSRGGSADIGMGAGWHRTMSMIIPVRKRDLWTDAAVKKALESCLSFLAGEQWRFSFQAYKSPPHPQEYFEFGEEWTPECDAVLLFSGGLDSLAGAVQEIERGRKRLALVSHRSNPKTARLLHELVGALKESAPKDVEIIHVPVWVSKDSSLTHESSQRTRSFLFAVLGMAVARLVQCANLQIYENGVVTFNLPISEQLVGARASRSTHPCAIAKFEEIFKRVAMKEGTVENGFLWSTKTDVVRVLQNANRVHLIAKTESCGGTFRKTREKTHCGVCSQCIDRRFAVLAAGEEGHDPESGYRVDLLRGARKEGAEQTMLESYIRTALDYEGMDERGFFSGRGEVSRALRCLGGKTEEQATRMYDLHRRHGESVVGVLVEGHKGSAREVVHGELPPSCGLMLVPFQARRAARPGTGDAFCVAVTRDGEAPMSREEYEARSLNAMDYDVFIDGITGHVEVRENGKSRIGRLTAMEFAIVETYVLARKVMRPKAVDVLAKETPASARRMFSRARKKVDIRQTRYKWRLFKTVRGAADAETSYLFDPPNALKYCLIRPVKQ